MSVTLTFDAKVEKPIASPATGAMLNWRLLAANRTRRTLDKIAVVDNHGASSTCRHRLRGKPPGKLVTVSRIQPAIAWPFSFRAA